ncbi:hypothetical protein N431DRAFT_456774 [Stipitochalara longipes BDJ]|nr:hypothetical protein N431DRAFT_456774 [Stipitochalara longipes BDJ]
MLLFERLSTVSNSQIVAWSQICIAPPVRHKREAPICRGYTMGVLNTTLPIRIEGLLSHDEHGLLQLNFASLDVTKVSLDGRSLNEATSQKKSKGKRLRRLWQPFREAEPAFLGHLSEKSRLLALTNHWGGQKNLCRGVERRIPWFSAFNYMIKKEEVRLCCWEVNIDPSGPGGLSIYAVPILHKALRHIPG